MSEFVFEDMQSPWRLALSRLHRGDTLSAGRFLALLEVSDDSDAEDAALELERLGVMLDVSDLPVVTGNPDTQNRLRLEQKLLTEGGLMDNLEANDPLRLFLEEMSGFEPISDGSKLAARGAQGDENALQTLTNGYLATVLDCAREFTGKGVLLLDLIQEGSLGLWQGILSYRSGDFRPHALWWIRQAMARAVTLQALENGVGQNLSAQLDRYQKADKALLTRIGRNPTDQEIAQELGITLEETASLGKMLREIRSLAKIKQGSQPTEESPEDDLAVEDTAYYQERQRIDDMLSGLNEQEAMLLRLRYGLDGKPPVTALEAGKLLNLTADEVVVLEAAALTKLRRTGE